MMTMMLLVPNPQKIRLALHARRNTPEMPYEETLVASLDPAEVDESTSEEDENDDATETVTSEPPVPRRESSPVRVANADPTASIGYEPAPAAMEKRLALPVVAQPEPSSVPPLDIPVPEPVSHDTPAKTLTRISEAPATAPQPLAVATTQAAIAPPPFPGGSSPAESTVSITSPITPEELSDDESISITTGSQSKRWNFRFNNSQLENVFKVLGRYQGYTVVIDEELRGSYTGQFLDADPAQAFAVIVKSHDCSVSRRGNILMLSRRPAGNYR